MCVNVALTHTLPLLTIAGRLPIVTVNMRALIVLLIVASSWATHEVTRHHTFKNAYAAGKSVGREEGIEDSRESATWITGSADAVSLSFNDEYNKLSADHDKLISDYNQLVNQYNELLRYANTPRYQPASPLSCTSSAVGTFTYTNCY